MTSSLLFEYVYKAKNLNEAFFWFQELFESSSDVIKLCKVFLNFKAVKRTPNRDP